MRLYPWPGIIKDEIRTCEKSVALRSGNFSDLNSACLKVLILVKTFQFSDMHNEIKSFSRHFSRSQHYGVTKLN